MRRIHCHRVGVVLVLFEILFTQDGVRVSLPSPLKISRFESVSRQALASTGISFRGSLEPIGIKSEVSAHAAQALMSTLESIGPNSLPLADELFFGEGGTEYIGGSESFSGPVQSTLAGDVAAYRQLLRKRSPFRQAGRMVAGGYVIYHAIPPKPWRPPQSEAVVVHSLVGNMMLATGALQHRSGFIGAQVIETADGKQAKSGFVLHEGTPKRLFARLLGFSRRIHGTEKSPFVWVVSVDRSREGEIQRILETIQRDPLHQHLRILFIARGSRCATILATPKGISLSSREGGGNLRLGMSWDQVLNTLEGQTYRVCELKDLLPQYAYLAQSDSGDAHSVSEKSVLSSFLSEFAVRLDQLSQHLWRYANSPSTETRSTLENQRQFLFKLLQMAHLGITQKVEGWSGLSARESWNILNLVLDQFNPSQRSRIAEVDELLLALLLPHSDKEYRLGEEALKARLGSQFHPFGLGPTFDFVLREIDDVWETLGRFHPGLQVRLQSFYARWWLRNEHGGLASIPFKNMAESEERASLAKVIFLPAANDLRQVTRLATHEKMHQLLGYLFSKASTLRKSGTVGEADWFTESIAILFVVYFAGRMSASQTGLGDFQIGIEASATSNRAARVAFINDKFEEEVRRTGERKRPALLYYDQAAVLAGLAYGDALAEAAATGQSDNHRRVLEGAVGRILRALLVPDTLTFDRLIEIVSESPQIPLTPGRMPFQQSLAAA